MVKENNMTQENAQEPLSPEAARQLKIGLKFMKRYKETFKALAELEKLERESVTNNPDSETP